MHENTRPNGRHFQPVPLWLVQVDLLQAEQGQVSHHKEVLGRCLGPTHDDRNEMEQWILQQNGQVVPTRTLRRLSREELNPNKVMKLAKRQALDSKIERRLGNSRAVSRTPEVNNLDPNDENCTK